MELTEAYIIGLLADLENEIPRLLREMALAGKRAEAVGAELSGLLQRLDESKSAIKQARQQIDRSALNITERNQRIASLHQEIATIRRRSEDYKTEMDRLGPGAIQRRLRRERAKLTVQMDDRQEEIESLRASVQEERHALQRAEERQLVERDRSRVITSELDKLQSQLPSPYLYTQLFNTSTARAHCLLHLEGDVGSWTQQIREAIDYSVQLHGELRAGKYRLDQNSDLVGGRAMATAEALYACVLIGDMDRARELFASATDPGLYFHQIFNVFRVWCLGLYLTGKIRDLRELLRVHQFAPGLRGGYVQAFIGLLAKDPRRVSVGLKDITKHEWELWQDPSLVRGMGLINLGGSALAKIALERGIPISTPGPTIPDPLFAA